MSICVSVYRQIHPNIVIWIRSLNKCSCPLDKAIIRYENVIDFTTLFYVELTALYLSINSVATLFHAANSKFSRWQIFLLRFSKWDNYYSWEKNTCLIGNIPNRTLKFISKWVEYVSLIFSKLQGTIMNLENKLTVFQITVCETVV